MASVDNERRFDDPVLEETTLARMFENSASRHAESAAQRYKGGVYDRSLAGVAFPDTPDGEFAALTYEEMADVVHNLAAGFRELGVERRPDGYYVFHERAKQLIVLTQENGLMTLTLKMKRRDIRERYADGIADTYGEKEFEQAPSADDD